MFNVLSFIQASIDKDAAVCNQNIILLESVTRCSSACCIDAACMSVHTSHTQRALEESTVFSVYRGALAADASAAFTQISRNDVSPSMSKDTSAVALPEAASEEGYIRDVNHTVTASSDNVTPGVSYSEPALRQLQVCGGNFICLISTV